MYLCIKLKSVKMEQISDKQRNLNTEEIEKCITILEKLVEDETLIAQLTDDKRIALMIAAGRVSLPNRQSEKLRLKASKKIKKQAIVQQDKSARSQTGIRSARKEAVFVAPQQIAIPENTIEQRVLSSPRNCYVCKKEFTHLHFFYDAMCKECGDFNYHKRFQNTEFTGKTALITGSRLKIGYHVTLKLLRAGATVIATTRFPIDSAKRFAQESDYQIWKDRLHIYGLDLRHIPSVEIFATYIEQTFDRLDILINNAAQTVRRPAGFYSHLMENEKLSYHLLPTEVQLILKGYETCKNQLSAIATNTNLSETNLPVAWHGNAPGIGIRSSALLSQIPYSFDNSLAASEVFPQGELDADLQQVDLRTTNSWRLKLGEINVPEMLEVQLVNSVAPFVLCNRLINMMKKDFTGQKHIVNVSAMEGKFHKFMKADRHPHTNMAKAALNMLTHTSASELAKHGIYMNAVDTGWVTDEDPIQLSAIKQEIHDFQPPLDIVDGAARVCDPFIDGILTGKHWCGQFLKDYRPIDW